MSVALAVELDEAATPAVQTRTLYRFFRTGDEETLALQGVSLAVEAGELVAVVGPSGSGKSTLLACIAGLDEPDGGTVFIGGSRMSHQPERARATLRAQQVGVLFQSANLIEHLTVEQNLGLAQSLADRAVRSEGAVLLSSLGLSARARSYPSQLSGGEATRAGLAIALANAPAVLLADEPTGELDSGTEAQVLQLFVAAARRGVAVLVASHSPAIAAAAHRVVRLEDGRIVA